MIRKGQFSSWHLQKSKTVVLSNSVIFGTKVPSFGNRSFFRAALITLFSVSILYHKLSSSLRILIKSSKTFSAAFVNIVPGVVFVVERTAECQHINAFTPQTCCHRPRHGLKSILARLKTETTSAKRPQNQHTIITCLSCKNALRQYRHE